MSAASRTVYIPVNAGASWDDFAWDAKYPGDDLPYVLDGTEWLADGDLILESVAVAASPGLTVSPPVLSGAGNAATIVTAQIRGGAPGTIALVAFYLTLDDGRCVTVLVALPIRLALPTGLILAGQVSGGLTNDLGQSLINDFGLILVADPLGTGGGNLADDGGNTLSNDAGQNLTAP